MPTATLLPLLQQGDEAWILLGYRRAGPLKGHWTEVAADLDAPPVASAATSSTGRDAAARAGHAALMGLLGTALQIQHVLSTDLRFTLPASGGGGHAYVLRVDPNLRCVCDMYNNLSRYVAGAFVKEADGGLRHCPPSLLAFSQIRWVSLSDIRAKLSTVGMSSALRATAMTDALHMSLAPRTVDLFRHTLAFLDAVRATLGAHANPSGGSGGGGGDSGSGRHPSRPPPTPPTPHHLKDGATEADD